MSSPQPPKIPAKGEKHDIRNIWAFAKKSSVVTNAPSSPHTSPILSSDAVQTPASVGEVCSLAPSMSSPPTANAVLCTSSHKAGATETTMSTSNLTPTTSTPVTQSKSIDTPTVSLDVASLTATDAQVDRKQETDVVEIDDDSDTPASTVIGTVDMSTPVEIAVNDSSLVALDIDGGNAKSDSGHQNSSASSSKQTSASSAAPTNDKNSVFEKLMSRAREKRRAEEEQERAREMLQREKERKEKEKEEKRLRKEEEREAKEREKEEKRLARDREREEKLRQKELEKEEKQRLKEAAKEEKRLARLREEEAEETQKRQAQQQKQLEEERLRSGELEKQNPIDMVVCSSPDSPISISSSSSLSCEALLTDSRTHNSQVSSPDPADLQASSTQALTHSTSTPMSLSLVTTSSTSASTSILDSTSTSTSNSSSSPTLLSTPSTLSVLAQLRAARKAKTDLTSTATPTPASSNTSTFTDIAADMTKVESSATDGARRSPGAARRRGLALHRRNTAHQTPIVEAGSGAVPSSSREDSMAALDARHDTAQRSAEADEVMKAGEPEDGIERAMMEERRNGDHVLSDSNVDANREGEAALSTTMFTPTSHATYTPASAFTALSAYVKPAPVATPTPLPISTFISAPTAATTPSVPMVAATTMEIDDDEIPSDSPMTLHSLNDSTSVKTPSGKSAFDLISGSRNLTISDSVRPMEVLDYAYEEYLRLSNAEGIWHMPHSRVHVYAQIEDAQEDISKMETTESSLASPGQSCVMSEDDILRKTVNDSISSNTFVNSGSFGVQSTERKQRYDKRVWRDACRRQPEAPFPGTYAIPRSVNPHFQAPLEFPAGNEDMSETPTLPTYVPGGLLPTSVASTHTARSIAWPLLTCSSAVDDALSTSSSSVSAPLRTSPATASSASSSCSSHEEVMMTPASETVNNESGTVGGAVDSDVDAQSFSTVQSLLFHPIFLASLLQAITTVPHSPLFTTVTPVSENADTLMREAVPLLMSYLSNIDTEELNTPLHTSSSHSSSVSSSTMTVALPLTSSTSTRDTLSSCLSYLHRSLPNISEATAFVTAYLRAYEARRKENRAKSTAASVKTSVMALFGGAKTGPKATGNAPASLVVAPSKGKGGETPAQGQSALKKRGRPSKNVFADLTDEEEEEKDLLAGSRIATSGKKDIQLSESGNAENIFRIILEKILQRRVKELNMNSTDTPQSSLLDSSGNFSPETLEVLDVMVHDAAITPTVARALTEALIFLDTQAQADDFSSATSAVTAKATSSTARQSRLRSHLHLLRAHILSLLHRTLPLLTPAVIPAAGVMLLGDAAVEKAHVLESACGQSGYRVLEINATQRPSVKHVLAVCQEASVSHRVTRNVAATSMSTPGAAVQTPTSVWAASTQFQSPFEAPVTPSTNTAAGGKKASGLGVGASSSVLSMFSKAQSKVRTATPLTASSVTTATAVTPTKALVDADSDKVELERKGSQHTSRPSRRHQTRTPTSTSRGPAKTRRAASAMVQLDSDNSDGDVIITSSSDDDEDEEEKEEEHAKESTRTSNTRTRGNARGGIRDGKTPISLRSSPRSSRAATGSPATVFAAPVDGAEVTTPRTKRTRSRTNTSANPNTTAVILTASAKATSEASMSGGVDVNVPLSLPTQNTHTTSMRDTLGNDESPIVVSLTQDLDEEVSEFKERPRKLANTSGLFPPLSSLKSKTASPIMDTIPAHSEVTTATIATASAATDADMAGGVAAEGAADLVACTSLRLQPSTPHSSLTLSKSIPCTPTLSTSVSTGAFLPPTPVTAKSIDLTWDSPTLASPFASNAPVSSRPEALHGTVILFDDVDKLLFECPTLGKTLETLLSTAKIPYLFTSQSLPSDLRDLTSQATHYLSYSAEDTPASISVSVDGATCDIELLLLQAVAEMEGIPITDAKTCSYGRMQREYEEVARELRASTCELTRTQPLKASHIPEQPLPVPQLSRVHVCRVAEEDPLHVSLAIFICAITYQWLPSLALHRIVKTLSNGDSVAAGRWVADLLHTVTTHTLACKGDYRAAMHRCAAALATYDVDAYNADTYDLHVKEHLLGDHGDVAKINTAMVDAPAATTAADTTIAENVTTTRNSNDESPMMKTHTTNNAADATPTVHASDPTTKRSSILSLPLNLSLPTTSPASKRTSYTECGPNSVLRTLLPSLFHALITRPMHLLPAATATTFPSHLFCGSRRPSRALQTTLAKTASAFSAHVTLRSLCAPSSSLTTLSNTQSFVNVVNTVSDATNTRAFTIPSAASLPTLLGPPAEEEMGKTSVEEKRRHKEQHAHQLYVSEGLSSLRSTHYTRCASVFENTSFPLHHAAYNPFNADVSELPTSSPVELHLALAMYPFFSMTSALQSQFSAAQHQPTLVRSQPYRVPLVLPVLTTTHMVSSASSSFTSPRQTSSSVLPVNSSPSSYSYTQAPSHSPISMDLAATSSNTSVLWTSYPWERPSHIVLPRSILPPTCSTTTIKLSKSVSTHVEAATLFALASEEYSAPLAHVFAYLFPTVPLHSLASELYLTPNMVSMRGSTSFLPVYSSNTAQTSSSPLLSGASACPTSSAALASMLTTLIDTYTPPQTLTLPLTHTTLPTITVDTAAPLRSVALAATTVAAAGVSREHVHRLWQWMYGVDSSATDVSVTPLAWEDAEPLLSPEYADLALMLHNNVCTATVAVDVASSTTVPSSSPHAEIEAVAKVEEDMQAEREDESECFWAAPTPMLRPLFPPLNVRLEASSHNTYRTTFAVPLDNPRELKALSETNAETIPYKTETDMQPTALSSLPHAAPPPHAVPTERPTPTSATEIPPISSSALSLTSDHVYVDEIGDVCVGYVRNITYKPFTSTQGAYDLLSVGARRGQEAHVSRSSSLTTARADTDTTDRGALNVVGPQGAGISTGASPFFSLESVEEPITVSAHIHATTTASEGDVAAISALDTTAIGDMVPGNPADVVDGTAVSLANDTVKHESLSESSLIVQDADVEQHTNTATTPVKKEAKNGIKAEAMMDDEHANTVYTHPSSQDDTKMNEFHASLRLRNVSLLPLDLYRPQYPQSRRLRAVLGHRYVLRSQRHPQFSRLVKMCRFKDVAEGDRLLLWCSALLKHGSPILTQYIRQTANAARVQGAQTFFAGLPDATTAATQAALVLQSPSNIHGHVAQQPSTDTVAHAVADSVELTPTAEHLLTLLSSESVAAGASAVLQAMHILQSMLSPATMSRENMPYLPSSEQHTFMRQLINKELHTPAQRCPTRPQQDATSASTSVPTAITYSEGDMSADMKVDASPLPVHPLTWLAPPHILRSLAEFLPTGLFLALLPSASLRELMIEASAHTAFSTPTCASSSSHASTSPSVSPTLSPLAALQYTELLSVLFASSLPQLCPLCVDLCTCEQSSCYLEKQYLCLWEPMSASTHSTSASTSPAPSYPACSTSASSTSSTSAASLQLSQLLLSVDVPLDDAALWAWGTHEIEDLAVCPSPVSLISTSSSISTLSSSCSAAITPPSPILSLIATQTISWEPLSRISATPVVQNYETALAAVAEHVTVLKNQVNAHLPHCRNTTCMGCAAVMSRARTKMMYEDDSGEEEVLGSAEVGKTVDVVKQVPVAAFGAVGIDARGKSVTIHVPADVTMTAEVTQSVLTGAVTMSSPILTKVDNISAPPPPARSPRVWASSPTSTSAAAMAEAQSLQSLWTVCDTISAADIARTTAMRVDADIWTPLLRKNAKVAFGDEVMGGCVSTDFRNRGIFSRMVKSGFSGGFMDERVCGVIGRGIDAYAAHQARQGEVLAKEMKKAQRLEKREERESRKKEENPGKRRRRTLVEDDEEEEEAEEQRRQGEKDEGSAAFIHAASEHGMDFGISVSTTLPDASSIRLFSSVGPVTRANTTMPSHALSSMQALTPVAEPVPYSTGLGWPQLCTSPLHPHPLLRNDPLPLLETAVLESSLPQAVPYHDSTGAVSGEFKEYCGEGQGMAGADLYDDTFVRFDNEHEYIKLLHRHNRTLTTQPRVSDTPNDIGSHAGASEGGKLDAHETASTLAYIERESPQLAWVRAETRDICTFMLAHVWSAHKRVIATTAKSDPLVATRAPALLQRPGALAAWVQHATASTTAARTPACMLPVLASVFSLILSSNRARVPSWRHSDAALHYLPALVLIARAETHHRSEHLDAAAAALTADSRRRRATSRRHNQHTHKLAQCGDAGVAPYQLLALYRPFG